MTAPTYPGSSDVTSGQATLSSHYNNLRADAVRLGAGVADAVSVGNLLAELSAWVRPEYLATNCIRVPYSATRKPTLVIDGYLCQATANVDLPASQFSGAAAVWYIFANRTAASTTFTLTVSASATEAADQRLIGRCYWDGSNVDQGSVRGEELERAGYIQVGASAEKSTSPAAGDIYLATDTGLIYVCYLAGTWGSVTGAGALVFSVSPVLETPILGAATATSLNGLALTEAADGFAIAGGTTSERTLTVIGSDAIVTEQFKNVLLSTLYGVVQEALTWAAAQIFNATVSIVATLSGALLAVNQSGTGDIVTLQDAGVTVIRFPDGGGIVVAPQAGGFQVLTGLIGYDNTATGFQRLKFQHEGHAGPVPIDPRNGLANAQIITTYP